MKVTRLRGDLPTVLEHGAPGAATVLALWSGNSISRGHDSDAHLALEEMIGEVLKVDACGDGLADRALGPTYSRRVNRERMAGRRTRGCSESSSVDLCWSSGRR